ncbi:hypothetical protein HAX54_002239 [Datura stramonium]|uniref:Uncharacterized protein n=1 Tax=Datura stramonium TaxID=4076 RepID=A0ABS8T4L8_DATST|nr:hypothetical protein [Datura stramonium]
MSSSRHQDKGKAPMGVGTPQESDVDKDIRITQLRFSLEEMARQNLMKHKGRGDKMPCLSAVLVRGKEVDITPEVINSIYWVDQICSGSWFTSQRTMRDDQHAWVPGIIA